MKRLFLLTSAIAITTIASAQIQFGVKAGLNIANLSVKPSDGTSFSMKLNFNGGLLVALPVMENLKIQAEAMYSGQGVKDKYTDNATNQTINEKVSFGYINVPILVKYQHESGLFAEIGPQIGFLLSAKSKATEGDQTSNTDFKSDLKTVDFAGCLGIGYLSKFNVGIDARYNLSFVNISKTNGTSIKNGVIQIGIFYVIGDSGRK
jgi:Outer membrane protein beta-barrel domain